MNRCSKSAFTIVFVAASAILALAGASFSPEAQAQRMFPQKVQRGKISFTNTREVVLNDRPERLAPGAVVRTERNTIALTGSLRGHSYTVNYLRDPMGLVREVWILTPTEIERPLRGQAAAPSGERDAALYTN